MRIEIEDKSFGDRQILGPLLLEARRGQRIAVLGPSGVGKSTLLRIVAGLDTGFSGQVSGEERLAYVFQEPNLLPWRMALQNITIPSGCADDTAIGLMAQVGLTGYERHFPRQMSLGQQRRLALARAFAVRPDILLMDEPFASLDPETASRMISLTMRLLDESGAGLLLVTHDATEAQALSAREFHLSGTPARLMPSAPA